MPSTPCLVLLNGKRLSAVEDPGTLADIHAEELFSSPAWQIYRLKALKWLSEPVSRPATACPFREAIDIVVAVCNAFLHGGIVGGTMVAGNMLTNLICIQII